MWLKNIARIKYVPQLRIFHYRLLLNKIFTNDTLKKWRIVDSDKCDYCDCKQTILHLLIECQVSQKLWSLVELIINVNKVKLTKDKITLNIVNSNKTIISQLLVTTRNV